MKSVGRRLTLAIGLAALAAVTVMRMPAMALDGRPHSILILASEDSLLAANRILTDTIVSSLRTSMPEDLAIFTEFMDSSRRESGPIDRELVPALKARYARQDIDLIFALGPQALQLLLQERNDFFTTTPIVFVAVSKRSLPPEGLPADVSGVTLQFDLPGTVDLARSLQPDLGRLVIVTGASDFDRRWRETAEAALAGYSGNLAIEHLSGLPMDELLARVGDLPTGSAILYLTVFKDGNGQALVPLDVASRVAAAANVPVYGVYPTMIGDGFVGVYATPFEQQGLAAAELALPVLRGGAGRTDPQMVEIAPTPQIDWRMLELWGLDAARLPARAMVHFRTLSAWEQYWAAIVAALALVAAQAVVIVTLVRQHRRLRQAERLLAEANDQMEVAANASSLGLWSWTPDINRVWMTGCCRQMLGVTDVKDMDLDRFIHCLVGTDDGSVRGALLSAMRRQAPCSFEFSPADGLARKRWLSLSGNWMQRDKFRRMTGTLADITALKAAQMETEQQRKQLIHLTRVAALGEISGALAHELNQPLAAIRINAQAGARMIENGTIDAPEMQAILADILQDDQRAGDIIRKLRSFVRKEEVDYVAMAPNLVIEEVLALVHGDLIERHIRVIDERARILPMVRGDRVQIQQVLMNLILNACDAMGSEAKQFRAITLRTELTAPGTVTFSVLDSGPGLPVTLRDQIFEPFVTTKTLGMGLGLSICRTILVAHEGRIWCANNPAGGAEFKFSLPVYKAEAKWAS